RDAPHGHGEAVADARAEPVHQPPGKREPERVRGLERAHDVAVLQLVPPDLLLQVGRENTQDLSIDVVDRRRRKQKRADGPAHPPPPRDGRFDRHVARGFSRTFGDGSVSHGRRLHVFTPLARNPPSTARMWPVTKLAASDARKTAAPASSSTFPNRP